MQSFILLEIQHNAVGIIESPVCRRKGEKIRPFLTRGPFCHGSLQRAALHTVVCIPTWMWEFLSLSPHCGVSNFSPLAFETLGSQHSCCLLECLNSEHRYARVIVGQDNIIQTCKKDKKTPIFPFLDLYIRRSNSIHIFLCKEPEKGLSVVGWL